MNTTIPRLFIAATRQNDGKTTASLGLIGANDADINEYVTSKAMDGLFSVIADEERAIRQDPLGQASALLKRVFGAR